MDILWAILAGICLIVGLIGCFLPVLPGTPIAYIGLLLMELRSEPPFTLEFMVIWLAVTVVVALLDYWIPAFGTKKFGGTRWGVYGSVAGLIAGLIFFPPFGIIFGPLVGALVGELLYGSDHKTAMKAALGSFAGFVAGTLIKVGATAGMFYYYIQALV